MIEITSRWGLSKTGILTVDEKVLKTPVILNTDNGTEESFLSDENGFEIRVPKSFFKPLEGKLSVPATFAYTGAAGGHHVESKGGGRDIQVVYDQEPDPEAEIYILGNSPELLGRGSDLVDRILSLRSKIPFHKLIYLPGIALPNNISLLTYMGVDIFDTVYVDYLGSMGIEVSDWMGFSGDVKLNRYRLQDEIRLIRKSISLGRIRELVEARVRSEPWLVEALRRMDSNWDILRPYIPVTGGNIFVTTREAFYRPDIVRFRHRMLNRYEPPERDVLLLLPCSARKPYFSSRSHGKFKASINNGNWTNVHEVVLTSPLGMVPRELELFYPAQNYDIPVTHTWYEEERDTIIEMVDNLLYKGNYRTIISHLPEDMNFVIEHIDCIDTAQGDHPTHDAALGRLSEAVRAHAGRQRYDVGGYLKENLLSFSRFQFGPGGSHLLDDATVKGRYPEYKIMAGSHQRGMMVAERGLISLTLHGGEILKDNGINIVEIEDFVPKGTVFSVGVTDADTRICPGDDCVVVHHNELRGVGVAVMSGIEMTDAERGPAVKIRHHT